MAGEVASLLLSRMTVPVLFYMSERKKQERSAIEQLTSPTEASEETKVTSVESRAPGIESVSVVESAAESEPATGNGGGSEAEHDPMPETSDATNGIEDEESSGTNQ
jgi:hypothetical protein